MAFERLRVGVGAIAIGAFTGCAGPLAQGEGAFRRGDYPEAKRLLAGLESNMRAGSGTGHAEYALYRGLTFAALGDTTRADSWLEEARAIEEARPGSLSSDDAHRLETALAALCAECAPAP
jgi:hypothetical protein